MLCLARMKHSWGLGIRNEASPTVHFRAACKGYSYEPAYCASCDTKEEMADRRQAFQCNPELQRFVLHDVCSTGKRLGEGSYGSVEELEVNGAACAGKRLHETLVEQGNAGVTNIVRRYLQECQVMFWHGNTLFKTLFNFTWVKVMDKLYIRAIDVVISRFLEFLASYNMAS